MPPRESLYLLDWLRIAEQGLVRVERMLAVSDPGAAGFFLQQAVEKFLKGFLLAQGWKLARTHDLEALLNTALRYDASLEGYRAACQKITVFYMAERYPHMTDDELTDDDVRSSWNQILPLVQRVRESIPQPTAQKVVDQDNEGGE